MDGLFTVFGLGTAFGVFCSWVYDLIRQRKQPAHAVASFQAVHGDEVLPAPEPVSGATVSFSPEKSGDENGVSPLPPVEPSTWASHDEPLIGSRKETQLLETASVQETPAMKVVQTATQDQTGPFVFANGMPDVEFVPDEHATALPEARHPDFVDTVSFDATDTELPVVSTVVPRVVLLVNNTLVREVKENDLESIFKEFGIAQDSERAQTLLAGSMVEANGKSIQLAQT